MNKVLNVRDHIKKDYSSLDIRYEYPFESLNAIRSSGLTALPVPEAYGGLGVGFRDMVEVVYELAKGHPSVAQVFGVVHCFCAMAISESENEQLKKEVLEKVVKHGSLLGNASSERKSKSVFAYETVLEPQSSGGYRLNGEKFFSTGSPSADFLLTVGMCGDQIATAIIDAKSEGVHVRDDWRAMGQRGTGSGTVRFTNVFVPEERILMMSGLNDAPDYSNFFSLIAQAFFSAIYLGIATACYEECVDYIRKHARPWPGSNVSSGAEDPYMLRRIGRLKTNIDGARLLLWRAAQTTQESMKSRAQYDKCSDAMKSARTQSMVQISEAKVATTEISLEMTQRFFELCGARSTVAEYNYDRYWRDARTLTIHDPVDYKAKLIGEYEILGTSPVPTFLT